MFNKTTLILTIFLSVISLAVASFIPARAITFQNPLDADSIEELIDSLINTIFYLSIAIVPVVIVIGGFYYLISGGSPEKIRTAKNIILYAVIGFVIVALAKALISVIKSVLGGS